MAARLGNVFYWTGGIFACLLVSLGILVFVAISPAVETEKWLIGGYLIAFGIGAWLIGWASRYVLAGPTQ